LHLVGILFPHINLYLTWIFEVMSHLQ